MRVPEPGERVASNLTVTSLHAEPTRRAEQVTDALLGESLLVRGVGGASDDRWLRVEGADEYPGWLPASHVRSADGWPGIDMHTVRAVTATCVNAEGRPLRPLVFGCRLARGPDDAVSLPDGVRGRIDPAAFEPFHAGAGSVGEIVKRCAEAFAGVPYRWGGRSPWGFDCSGLVQLIGAELGWRLPRDSHQMEAALESRAARISPADVRAGDLIFWGRDRATHVAIALDGERFLHARDWVRIGAFASGPDADLAPKLRAIFRLGE